MDGWRRIRLFTVLACVGAALFAIWPERSAAQAALTAPDIDASAERARLQRELDRLRGQDARGEAVVTGQLAMVDAQMGRRSAAEEGFARSRDLARNAGDDLVFAQSAFNLALVRASRNEEALLWTQTVGVRGIMPSARPPRADPAEFEDAAVAAERAGLFTLAARSYAQAALRGRSILALENARGALARAPPSRDQVAAALMAADAAMRLHDFGETSALALAGVLLAESAANANALGDAALEGHARGLLARLAARQGRLAEAIDLTRQARFLTESSGQRGSSLVWSGQEAALLAQAGDTEAALVAYRRAEAEITASRAALAAAAPNAGQSAYRAAAEPILAAYADLLLQTARGAEAETRMRQARRLMEQVKTLQLDQYFQDECITQLVEAEVALEDVPANVAVIYPLILADRVEILVSTRGGAMVRSPLAADRAALEADARALRIGLRRDAQGRLTDAWRAPAQRLYAALIAPILPTLVERDIDTLVLAPDGALRGVPIAALHDGERFLVERFAIANALSLALVDPRPLESVQRRALVAGVSDSVAGLPPLPNVVSEVGEIGGLVDGAALLDEEFTQARFANAIGTGRYTIAHLATHASFGESAGDSFILAHDRRMSLGDVEAIMTGARVRGAPLELLVLSACETAAGDDNAVLGIAGVAYRAGARAVLASLWSIPDESTARLMPSFYRALLQNGETKAEALRSAQRALLADPATAHPYHWSAFILVGNWL